jgi:hypothetical protein
MEHNEMSINDSKIEFIEDDRLTDLAGGRVLTDLADGRVRFAAFAKDKIVCRGFGLTGAYSQPTRIRELQPPTCGTAADYNI